VLAVLSLHFSLGACSSPGVQKYLLTCIVDGQCSLETTSEEETIELDKGKGRMTA
jgi:hypothetical protein